MHRRLPRPLAALFLAALLAGCGAPSAPGTGDPNATSTGPTIEARPEDTDPGFPGLTLTGEVVSESPWRLRARALNAGPETYKVESMCTDSWAIQVQDAAGQPVATGPPTATCAAFGLGAFGPEEELVKPFAWNGTRYDGGRYQPAAPGPYAVVFTFRVYRGGAEMVEYDQAANLSVRLPIQVRP